MQQDIADDELAAFLKGALGPDSDSTTCTVDASAIDLPPDVSEEGEEEEQLDDDQDAKTASEDEAPTTCANQSTTAEPDQEDQDEPTFFVDVEGGTDDAEASPVTQPGLEEEIVFPLRRESVDHVVGHEGEGLARCAEASGAKLMLVAGSGSKASQCLISVRGTAEAVSVARRLLQNLSDELPEVIASVHAGGRGGRSSENAAGGAAGDAGICKWLAAGFCRNGTNTGRCHNGLHDPEAARKAETAWLGHAPAAGSVASARLPVLLLLDLEGAGNTRGRDGEDEIIEIPVLAMCPVTGSELGRFHRFTKPGYWCSQASEMRRRYPMQCFNAGSSAVLFPQAIFELQTWIGRVLRKPPAEITHEDFLFVTCGNWDVKTAIPRQCQKPPPGGGVDMATQKLLFSRWCNIKEAFREHFKLSEAAAPTGMRGMLRRLNIPLAGQHHLGMDDVSNLARVLSTLVLNRANLAATGYASASDQTGNKRAASCEPSGAAAPTFEDQLAAPDPGAAVMPPKKALKSAQSILAKYSNVHRAEAAGADVRIKGTAKVGQPSPPGVGSFTARTPSTAQKKGSKGRGKNKSRNRRPLQKLFGS
eukprot:TRINITY_DN107046_c0_g1_i1.p1 TRINITY_DN107046_c0_g1~~TRINITY_DN107046_c0_g1_i1.p1  ORF type:complete len:590 (+),score=115.83 TRINITY_DN107046_c0_g1_i1:114-1883(+)